MALNTATTTKTKIDPDYEQRSHYVQDKLSRDVGELIKYVDRVASAQAANRQQTPGIFTAANNSDKHEKAVSALKGVVTTIDTVTQAHKHESVVTNDQQHVAANRKS